MEIGGLQKTTLIDYPGRVACTVFLVKCNFKCPFCYSSELVLKEKIKQQPKIPEQDFFDFLKKRIGQLDGVVVCGGEPTVNPELPELCKKIKEMGFLVKLDTNGSNPEMLQQLISDKLVDYVAMDIKASKEKYPEAIGHGRDFNDIVVNQVSKSVDILNKREVDYEFRTTFAPKILTKQDILDIAKWISPAKRYYIQNFVPQKTLDPEFEHLKPHPDEEALEIKEQISGLFDVCEIR